MTAVSCGAPVGRGRVAEPESTPPRCYDSDALLRRQAAAQNGVGRRWPVGRNYTASKGAGRGSLVFCRSRQVAKRDSLSRPSCTEPAPERADSSRRRPTKRNSLSGLLALDPLLGEWTPAAGAPAGGPALHVMGSYLPPPACHHAAIAQLGERQTEDLKVPGSIPGLGRLVSPHSGQPKQTPEKAPSRQVFHSVPGRDTVAALAHGRVSGHPRLCSCQRVRQPTGKARTAVAQAGSFTQAAMDGFPSTRGPAWRLARMRHVGQEGAA